MQPGKIVLIAFVTSAITATGTFFGLHHTVGKKALQRAAAANAMAVPSTPSTSAVPAVPATAAPTAPAPAPAPAAPVPAAAQPTPKVTIKPPPAEPAQPTQPGGVREANTTVSEVGQKIAVPRVTGVWLHSAQSRLRKAKLNVKVRYTYDEDRSEGLVLRQSPKAGARVERGATIRLTVNRDYD